MNSIDHSLKVSETKNLMLEEYSDLQKSDEILEIFFSNLNGRQMAHEEFARAIYPHLSIRRWTHHASAYLKTHKKQVISFCKNCSNECYIIPELTTRHYVDYMFACTIKGNHVIVKGENVDAVHDVDFYLKAKIQVFNISIADDALGRSIRTFFSKGRWINYASINMIDVQPILKFDIKSEKRNLIINICNAANYYFMNGKITELPKPVQHFKND